MRLLARQRMTRLPASFTLEGMKIALGQINPTVGDFCGNAAKIIGYTHTARHRGADLI